MPSHEAAADGQASTSRSLLARVQANDPAAWDRLVTLYAPLVWHWCRRMHLPHQETADVFQEVFKAVAVHFPRFHHDRPEDTFRGWLRTITRNKVRDYFRRTQHEPEATGGTDAQLHWSQVPALDPDNELEAGQDSLLFQRALSLIQSEFEERSWRAFWRVVVDGCPPQQVADELGMSTGSVRVAKCRILHRLRQELGDAAGSL
jgi:RNA polymerase sigma-70 factor (ECF subfamily)